MRFILKLFIISFLTFCLSANAGKRPNVLFIAVDDLRSELNCFGADYIHSPHIDALAKKGRAFTHHYVNAPSCGPSRYTLLTGTYGSDKNEALFLRAKQINERTDDFHPSMPEWFRNNGYTTVSVGKISHHPGGRGGKDWNDDSIIEVPKAWDRHLMPVGEWEHPRGAMHGLANGEIRIKASDMAIYQSTEGNDNIYPDGLIASEGIHQLKELAALEEPFFLAIGLLKPHLPFGAPKKYMDLYKNAELPPIPHPEKPNGVSTWHPSGEFMNYNRWGKDPREDKAFADSVRLHYAACVSYVDHHIGMIIEALEATGKDKNTIIVLWGDHGWHLGEHAIWGKHSLYEESLHSPLIIYYPKMKKAGKLSDAVVETLDIFPTLCDLTGVELPDYAQGKSLLPMLKKPKQDGHTVIAYNGGATTIRNQQYRCTIHKNGKAELYDHNNDIYETKNIASEHPELVEDFKQMIDSKLNQQLQ